MRLPVALSAFVTASTLVAASSGNQPNILWITAEDMNAHLGCYGDPAAHTPNLDALARQGVRYTRAFAAASVCSPSRATLISGVTANALGNPHLRCEVTLPSAFQGYPFYLREAGYFTTNNVKTDYNLRDEETYIRRWWNRCDAKAHWRQRAPGQPFMAVFNLMETHQSRTSVWPEAQFEKEIASRLSAAERADPVRTPVPGFYPDLPAAHRAMARYYDCIAAMDRRVGEILAELEADGLADETIVFFYGDNGMGMPGGKRLLRDSGMRVPLLIRFPQKWAHLASAAPGAVIDRLVSFVDFAPTVLSLAGVAIPRHFEGTAFLGQAAGAPRRYVYGSRDRVDEAFDTARSVRDERWLYIRNYRPHLSWSPPEGFSDASPFRRELLALARRGTLGTGATSWLAPTRPREEFYDTAADPFQARNLADEPAQEANLRRLRGALREWLLAMPDVSLLPEEQMYTRAAGKAPYDFARTPGAYPLERVLSAAEAVGEATAVARQRKWLTDADSAVRYWAAVGFAANRAGTAAARTDLEKALRDDSAPVRIEAATALLTAGEPQPALGVLEAALRHQNPDVALQAARALQLAGEKARPVLATVRERLAAAQKQQNQITQELFLVFSLGALAAELDGVTERR